MNPAMPAIYFGTDVDCASVCSVYRKGKCLRQWMNDFYGAHWHSVERAVAIQFHLMLQPEILVENYGLPLDELARMRRQEIH